jgi:hypothetical protein
MQESLDRWQAISETATRAESIGHSALDICNTRAVIVTLDLHTDAILANQLLQNDVTVRRIPGKIGG